MRAALIALVAQLPLIGCAQAGGPDDEGPFDRDTLVACTPGTASLGVKTQRGGRMSLRLLGGCFGEPTCESTDLFAPDAWATIRVAGAELLVEGCAPLSAVSSSELEVTFRPESGELETYSIPLEGACLDAGPMGCTRPPDGGSDSGMALDAATPTDAPIADAASSG